MALWSVDGVNQTKTTCFSVRKSFPSHCHETKSRCRIERHRVRQVLPFRGLFLWEYLDLVRVRRTHLGTHESKKTQCNCIVQFSSHKPLSDGLKSRHCAGLTPLKLASYHGFWSLTCAAETWSKSYKETLKSLYM